jgi:hypothetical protein
MKMPISRENEIAENRRKPPSHQEVAGSIPAAGFSANSF